MDMKKILQALDTASTKPVEGSNDMKKFVSIIQEAANPHKVALPVQMAMQHYSKPVEKKQPRESVISKYFTEAEEAITHRQVYKTVEIQEKASRIVERLRLKESALKDKEDLKAKRKAIQDIQLDPHTHKDPELKAELARRKAALEKEAKEKNLKENNAVDTIKSAATAVGDKLANALPLSMRPYDEQNVANNVKAQTNSKTKTVKENPIDKDLEKLQLEVWDFYKDVHGFRPRHWSHEEWHDPKFLQHQMHSLGKIVQNMTPEEKAENGWSND